MEQEDVAEVIASQLIEGAVQMEKIGFRPEDIVRAFGLAAERLRTEGLPIA